MAPPPSGPYVRFETACADLRRCWTDGQYPRRVRRFALLAFLLVAAGCGSAGKVSNDDDVSRKAATDAVEQFFTRIHAGDVTGACAGLPGPQRAGLARLSKSRGGPAP